MRCAWAESSDLMIEYHDTEWGVESRDDRYLFEMLILEGAQAGLSWSMVLNKRENYRAALDGFDIDKVAAYGEDKMMELISNPGIVRNRLKVASLSKNANGVISLRQECGSFSNYIWSWVDDVRIVNRPKTLAELATKSTLSDALSKDFKKRGFNFVGTTIIYSYLQAVGVIDDHVKGCLAIKK